jgi:large subunit ribosomal protein L25
MKKVSLSGSKRENVGKKDAKAVRNAGNVPVVLYGGKDQISFSIKRTDLDKLIFTPHIYLVELDIDGTNVQAILQDYQQDPITDKVVHADFLEVSDKKAVKIKLPITIEGSSPGVIQGGKMQQIFRQLRVEGLIKDLPETIAVNISKLNIGNAVRVSDMEVPGLRLLDSPNAVIVSVKMARGAVIEEEETEVATEEGATEAAAE